MLIRENSRFNERLHLGVDIVFNAEVLHQTSSIYSIGEHLYHVHQRPGSVTRLGNPLRTARLDEQYRALRDFYESKESWESVATDYYANVLSFSLPEAIGNSFVLAENRAHFVELLREIAVTDRISAALRHAQALRSVSNKQLLVALLLRARLYSVVASIYWK